MNKLHEENERLKKYNNKLMKQPLLFDVQTIPNTMEIMEANNKLEEENKQLKQFQEQVASVIEGKMGDNVCNDYKMEVLKEIWNELELDEVWFE